ncbi:MAG TPA: hypothetical protein VIG99_19275 [Myxococcaceae bacterium]|jgi:hypothetical protein
MIAQVATALVFFAGEGVDPAVAAATKAAVKERLSREGGAPLDLSAEHRTLNTRTPFVDFTAPPPAFLPPELAAAWKRSSEACAQQVGPTGPQRSPRDRAAAAAQASFCRQSLGLAIWDLLLVAKHVQRVVQVQMLANPARQRSTTFGASLLEPGGVVRTLTALDVNADRLTAAVLQAVEDLLGGAGTRVSPMPHALPSVGVPELAAASFDPPAGPANAPASCAGLPARLEVFPLGKMTRAIEVAYLTVPAGKRTGKPLRCDLVLYPEMDVRGGPVARARLSCPPAQVRGSGTAAQAPKMVATLVDDVVAALCSPERPQ